MPVPLDLHHFRVSSSEAASWRTEEEGFWSPSVLSEWATTPAVATRRLCVVDGCPHRSLDGAALCSHVLAHHGDRALVVDHVGQPVRVPYEGYWETSAKRFLLSCPLGAYVVTLTLQWEPRSLMCSVDAHDAFWTLWEVTCHDGEGGVTRAQLRARDFDYPEVDSVFYQPQSDKGHWPNVFLRLLLE